MILAAGKGTRLLPLTETVHKILVPVLGVPMLDRLTAYLLRGGVEALALNTHHLAEAVQAHLAAQSPPVPITCFHEPTLLDTGGGVLNAAPFWGDAPLLVWNGDILLDLDLPALMAAHELGGGLATLVVQARESDSNLLVDDTGALCGIASARRGRHEVVGTPRGEARPMAYNGVAVLSPALRPRIAREGPFDLVSALLEVVAAGGTVATHDAGGAFYGTTGNLAQLATLEAALEAQPELRHRWTPDEARP